MVGCTQFAHNTAQTIPPPATTIPQPRTDWEKGSMPPAGIGGWLQPRPLTDEEKAKVADIAVNSPEASTWLQGRTDFRASTVGWIVIVWIDGKAGYEWNLDNDETNLKYVSPYAYWYPRVTLAAGQGTIYLMSFAVDLDAGKIAFIDGPHPSLDSPDRFKQLAPTP